jgi:hypothetical protein
MSNSGIGSAGTPGFGQHAASVTKHDTNKFAPSYIFVGTAGTVTVDTAGGETDVAFVAPAGLVLPVECIRVKSTGTDANDFVRLW